MGSAWPLGSSGPFQGPPTSLLGKLRPALCSVSGSQRMRLSGPLPRAQSSLGAGDAGTTQPQGRASASSLGLGRRALQQEGEPGVRSWAEGEAGPEGRAFLGKAMITLGSVLSAGEQDNLQVETLIPTLAASFGE